MLFLKQGVQSFSSKIYGVFQHTASSYRQGPYLPHREDKNEKGGSYYHCVSWRRGSGWAELIATTAKKWGLLFFFCGRGLIRDKERLSEIYINAHTGIDDVFTFLCYITYLIKREILFTKSPATTADAKFMNVQFRWAFWAYNVNITNQFQTTLAGGGGGGIGDCE